AAGAAGGSCGPAGVRRVGPWPPPPPHTRPPPPPPPPVAPPLGPIGPPIWPATWPHLDGVAPPTPPAPACPGGDEVALSGAVVRSRPGPYRGPIASKSRGEAEPSMAIKFAAARFTEQEALLFHSQGKPGKLEIN